ncbi:MAG: phosphopantetheinyl transferase [Saprospiraceae bacterium]|jgi:phosphopantetheinyl transferase
MTPEDDHLRQELEAHGLDMKPLVGWHSKRQQEWIVGRYMMHTILPDRISDLLITPSGKPFFKNSSMQFSISHSGDLLGIITSSSTIGLDIQQFSQSLKKVSHKFITEENLKVFPADVPESDRQHILWCTKEAVFKAYGLGKVDFKKDILIHSYQDHCDYSVIKGRLTNDEVDGAFLAHFNRIGNYYIVSSIIE